MHNQQTSSSLAPTRNFGVFNPNSSINLDDIDIQNSLHDLSDNDAKRLNLLMNNYNHRKEQGLTPNLNEVEEMKGILGDYIPHEIKDDIQNYANLATTNSLATNNYSSGNQIATNYIDNFGGTGDMMNFIASTNNPFLLMYLYCNFCYDASFVAQKTHAAESVMMEDLQKVGNKTQQMLDIIQGLLAETVTDSSKNPPETKNKYKNIADLFEQAQSKSDINAFNKLNEFKDLFTASAQKQGIKDYWQDGFDKTTPDNDVNNMLYGVIDYLKFKASATNTGQSISQYLDVTQTDTAKNNISPVVSNVKNIVSAAGSLDTKLQTVLNTIAQTINALIELMGKNTTNYSTVLSSVARA